MSPLRHDTLISGPIDLGSLEGARPGRIGWLLGEALRARSWAAFQQRTGDPAIRDAKAASGPGWLEDPLHLLELDLVGQVGIALGEMSGKNTPSFGALLLGAFGTAERTSAGSLLVLLTAAANGRHPVKESGLHSTLLDLRQRDLSPFPYRFDVRDASEGRRIVSRTLDEDYTSLKAQGLLRAASPIEATQPGERECVRLLAPYPALEKALLALVEELREPEPEELFAGYLAESYERAL